ncbi:cyclic nucleotide-binding domain-containing protein [Nucisporomicrobium flavum]|uniref:cyclic nucleotide-binding domain-containing protein n=1 Tax=Nucisporomicrobium flavum TaxID=2785915 RepID=UPI0018F4C091|nr:cyclic nucleotide-binding domain-containing protein [Nucisporomicrobium flavum]
MSTHQRAGGITPTDLTARIPAQPFLAALVPHHLAALQETCVPVSYPQGARLFTEGAAADHFWLLDHGDVALDLQVPGHGALVLETLSAGTLLGWSWLYPPYRWHFGAVARTPVEALRFDAGLVLRRCEADPSFGYAVMRLVTPAVIDRLQATRLRLLDLYGPPGERRRR